MMYTSLNLHNWSWKIMIYIVNNDGDRLCNDGCWRSFANFGTYPECVKEYRNAGNAHRRAKKIKGTVVQLGYGQSVDASGSIISE